MNFTEIENLSEQEVINLYQDIIEFKTLQISTDEYLYYCTWNCRCSNGSNRNAYGYNNGDFTGRYDTDGNNNQWGFHGCSRISKFSYISGGCDGGVISSYAQRCTKYR